MRIAQLIQDWQRVARVCAKCGAPSWQGVALYCSICDWQLRDLESKGPRGRSYEHGFPTRWLYSWTPATDPVVGTVIRALKGGKRGIAWRQLAHRFSYTVSESGLAPTETSLFIPPPSRTGRPDHAMAWASALAEVWKGRVVAGLKTEIGLLEQKRLGVLERQQRRFHRENFSDLSTGARIIFADDVITTGATARAAYEALGKPKHFEAWALVNRPKLAGLERF